MCQYTAQVEDVVNAYNKATGDELGEVLGPAAEHNAVNVDFLAIA
jgi:hypothetical protein